MSYTAPDLADDVERALRNAGLLTRGDESTAEIAATAVIAISAHRDMLAALRAMLDSAGDDDTRAYRACELARAAIAKAGGK
jgi:cytochrome P450